MKTEVTKISRENLEVVFGKVTYRINECAETYGGCVKFKLLDKDTQGTLFTGTYGFDEFCTDLDEVFFLYLENNGIEGEYDDEKIRARYYKKAIKEYKENLEDCFWEGTDADVAEWIKDYFIRDCEEEVRGYYFTGNKRKKVHYVFY